MRKSGNDPSDPVYQDFRQLLALSEGRVSQTPGRFQKLRIAIKRCLERVAGVFETRVALAIGACLCLGLVGFSVLKIREKQRVIPPVPPQAVASPSILADAAYQPVFYETARTDATPDVSEGSFFVRVGS